jgi:hypothetical protein
MVRSRESKVITPAVVFKPRISRRGEGGCRLTLNRSIYRSNIGFQYEPGEARLICYGFLFEILYLFFISTTGMLPASSLPAKRFESRNQTYMESKR